MFDIGFLEILVILVITLLVVGPERMPEVARKAGQFVAKIRNFVDNVKNEGELRDTVRELQQAVDLKEEQDRFKNIQEDLYKGFEDVRDEIDFNELQRPFGNSEPTEQDKEQARRQLDNTDEPAKPKAESSAAQAQNQPEVAKPSDSKPN
jgi:sec-independent protein translocase protein TatB